MNEKINNLKNKATDMVNKTREWSVSVLMKLDRAFSKARQVSKYAVITLNVAFIAFFLLLINVEMNEFFNKLCTIVSLVLLGTACIAGLFAGTYKFLPSAVHAIGKALCGFVMCLSGGISMMVFNFGGAISVVVGILQCALWAYVFIGIILAVIVFPAATAWYFIWREKREEKMLGASQTNQ